MLNCSIALELLNCQAEVIIVLSCLQANSICRDKLKGQSDKSPVARVPEHLYFIPDAYQTTKPVHLFFLQLLFREHAQNELHGTLADDARRSRGSDESGSLG